MSNLLSQASLVMIPSGYKEDVVYSQIPTNGNGDLSFTRASNGTRINSAGLVEDVPWNLVEQSESIGTSPWTTPNVTITSGQTDPNGGSTAFLVVESTNGGSLRQAITQTGQLCYSIVLKYSSGTNKKASLFCTDANQQAGFDLEFGTVAYVSGSTATIESLGNGWYKCAMTFTPSTASTLILFPNYESGVGGVFAWHPQLNIGSTAKPYFPTTDRLNVPRLTYQNGGGGCPSLLLEKQSTNLVTYSEQFDNAGWLKFNGAGGSAPVVTPNYALSPDGTMNADRVQLARTTQTFSYSEIKQDFGTTGTQYTVSVYLKSLSGNPTISMANDGATFNFLATLTSEWVRYTATFTASGTPSAELILYEQVTSSSLTADFLVWGFQAEASSYPTSYIPTTSSSATRVADACFKTGISSLIGQTEGTIFLDAYFDDLDTVNFSISDGTSANYVLIDSSSGAVVFALVQQGGATQATINTSASFYTVGARLKCAIAYKANDFAFYINGNLIGTDNSGTVPACDQIRFARWNGVNPATQRVNEVITFPTRLTNAELAQLTA